MKEADLIEIIDNLKRELVLIKDKLRKIDDRHYKNDLKHRCKRI